MRRSSWGLVLAVALVAACGDSGGPSHTVTVTPALDSLPALGASVQLSAVAKTSGGDTIRNRPITWGSSAPGVVSVDGNGLATAHTNGSAIITATIDAVPGTAQIVVKQIAATLNIVEAGDTIVGIEKTSAFTIDARDSRDSAMAGAAIAWTARDTAVASVGANGVATARGLGATRIAATLDGVSDSADVTVVAHFYVSAGAGSDANTGTSVAQAFKTITHAFAVAPESSTIKVLPGVYDDIVNGETFPLMGAVRLYVIGDEANKGSGATPTIIVQRDTAATSRLYQAQANVVAGFVFTDSAKDDYSIPMSGSGFVFRNNFVANSISGVGGVNSKFALTTSGTGVVAGNVFNNVYLGIYLFTGSNLRIEDNIITGNAVGIAHSVAGGDMGGGARGSAGGNTITCNSIVDVEVGAGVAVSAANNTWDHVPPLQSVTFGGGMDIHLPADATITVTGATLAQSPCT
jgi:hypothetical protein